MTTNINISLSQLQNTCQTAIGKYIIHRPYLHLDTHHRMYREFQKHYNHQVKLKRKPITTELREIRLSLKSDKLDQLAELQLKLRMATLKETLAREEYQLLKEPHFRLMIEICRRIIQQQGIDNRTLAEYGKNRLDPAQPYHLRTNNAELKYNKGGLENRTILNHRKRLQTVGMILETKHHRGLHDFEMLINPAFLIFQEEEQPERGFFAPMLQTVECGLHPGGSESFSAKEKEKELSSTSTMPVNGVGDANTLSGASAKKDRLEREHRAMKTVPKDGPVAKPAEPLPTLQEMRKRTSTGGRAAANELICSAQSLKARKMWAVYYLILTFVQRLMPDRDLNDVMLENTAGQLYEDFFLPLSDTQAVDDHLLRSLQAVTKQAKFVEWRQKKGKNPFTKLPHLWFARQPDVKTLLKNKDFSTYHAQLVRIEKDKKKNTLREQYSKYAEQKARYEKILCEYLQEPTAANYHLCKGLISKNLPHFLDTFHRDILMQNGLA